MKMTGTLIGWAIFLLVVAGLYYVMKGTGRMKSLRSWGSLREIYGTNAMPDLYDLSSGMIGQYHYRNTLRVALRSEGVYLTPGVGINKQPVLIPYSAFTIDQSNRQISWGPYTYTYFAIQGVDVALDATLAQKIIRRHDQP